MTERHTIITCLKFFMLLTIITMSAQKAVAFEPYIRTKKSLNKTDKSLEKVERTIFLKKAVLQYVTKTPKGSRESRHHKWGDFFFGLNFGRPPGTNGSWDGWHFLNIYIKPDNESKPVQLEYFQPKQLFTYTHKGVNFAEIIWNIPGSTSTAKLKIAQFPSHKKWLFFRLSCSGTSSISQYNINCYPGNSNWTKLRNRILTSRSSSTNLNKQPATIHLKSPGLLFHNKYEREDDANFAIVDYPQVNLVEASKTTNCMKAACKLLPGTKSTAFGLGYIIGAKNPNHEYRMFLDEKQDGIYSFMKTIDWQSIPPKGDFNTLIKDINGLLLSPLLKDRSNINAFKQQLNNLKRHYKKAESKQDSAAAFDAIKQANNLKNKIINTGLEKLK